MVNPIPIKIKANNPCSFVRGRVSWKRRLAIRENYLPLLWPHFAKKTTGSFTYLFRSASDTPANNVMKGSEAIV
jgi:hypothetical protein